MPVKFLIIRFSSIGDIILTTPVVRCLKDQVEDAEIHYLTKASFEEIVKPNPGIDKVLVLKDSLSETVKEVKNEHYDYIIDLHRNIRTSVIKRKTGIPAFSFSKLNKEKWLLVNFGINRMPEKHIVDRYMETVGVFSVKNDGLGLDFFIAEKDEVNPEQLFGPELSLPYIAISVGAGHFTKRYPSKNIAEVCRLLPWPVVLLGGPEDSPSGDEIVFLAGKNVFNACGKTNLAGSASLIRQAAAVISNDTGLMHIAAALQKPVVALWGNTIPEFGMYPYLSKDKFINLEIKDLKCRPCSKIGFNKCPKKHFRCMEDIAPLQVKDSVMQLLEHETQNRYY